MPHMALYSNSEVFIQTCHTDLCNDASCSPLSIAGCNNREQISLRYETAKALITHLKTVEQYNRTFAPGRIDNDQVVNIIDIGET